MAGKLHVTYDLQVTSHAAPEDLGIAALNKVREEEEHLPWWLKTPDY